MQIESRREVNKIYIEKPNERLKDLFNTKEDMLAREYVIIHKNNVLMWIKKYSQSVNLQIFKQVIKWVLN